VEVDVVADFDGRLRASLGRDHERLGDEIVGVVQAYSAAQIAVQHRSVPIEHRRERRRVAVRSADGPSVGTDVHVTPVAATTIWFTPRRPGCSSGLVVVARLENDEGSVQQLTTCDAAHADRVA
jgi:hypothetical protein